MPTATTAPVSPLVRLRGKLQSLPPPTASDRARWERASRRRPQVTDDSPDLGHEVAGMIRCAESDSFTIPVRTAQWFRAHGGTRALMRALRSYMRDHSGDQARRRLRPSTRTTQRNRF